MVQSSQVINFRRMCGNGLSKKSLVHFPKNKRRIQQILQEQDGPRSKSLVFKIFNNNKRELDPPKNWPTSSQGKDNKHQEGLACMATPPHTQEERLHIHTITHPHRLHQFNIGCNPKATAWFICSCLHVAWEHLLQEYLFSSYLRIPHSLFARRGQCLLLLLSL